MSAEREARELEAAGWEQRGSGPKSLWRRPGGGRWRAHHQAYIEMRRERSAPAGGPDGPGGSA